MLPGVDIVRSARGEREMVFTQSLRLDYGTQSAQEVPLRAVVAVPELQLSSSWVDFGTCLVKQRQAREVCLMNLSGCQSYWAVLMGTRGRRALLLPPARPLSPGQTPPGRGCKPCPCRLAAGAGHLQPGPMPGDHRVAPLRAELWRALGLGEALGLAPRKAHTAVPPLPSVQGSRRQPRTQEPSRCPRAPACWRRGPTTGPRPPSACSSSSPPGAACWPPRAAHGWSRCPAPADLRPTARRSCELYQCTLVVDGVLGEKACALRLQGLGSHDERYASSLQP
ncbi:deleted in lung and esophageal cancer protein 1 isoform X1 [Oryctolagus cuniculus]|uniref:deleted in lung and esophageal cancer protein 1 isoform X1 n=1 Tax=Oryctolagus cuniculus TaxID=9986 RepID=UPI00387A5BC9